MRSLSAKTERPGGQRELCAAAAVWNRSTPMQNIDLISMFFLGLLGTGHCIGMCGPLIIAIPGQTGKFSAHLAYHAGRVGTYVIVGAVMGGLGTGLSEIARLTGISYPVSYTHLRAHET